VKPENFVEAENGRAKRSTTIQSISIAARFLDILAKSEGAMALGELARRAGTGTSTAHRYMQSLVLEGLVAQDRTTGRYDLGPAALHIGIGALRRIEPVEVAARLMKSLASTIVRWYRSSDFMVSTVSLGDVLPLDNTATGLVFQAFLPAERIEAARRMQPSSFRGKPPGADVLEEVRREGGADLKEHLFSLLTGKAAPVFDAQNEIACVVTTVSFIETAQAQDHRAALFEAARQASLEAGCA
jgi:DNA-binding IclR family transcriptional regulator